MSDFKWNAHAGLFLRSLLQPGLPKQYTPADTSRVTLVYFCVTGLDLLGKLGTLTKAQKEAVKEWVLAQQVHRVGDMSGGDFRRFGFRGGPFGGDIPFRSLSSAGAEETRAGGAGGASGHGNWEQDGQASTIDGNGTEEGHLAMTFAALATLAALGDDFESVDIEATSLAIRSLQQEDGSFRASHQDSTRDLRFTYCACAISSFLGDWSGIDRAKTVEYIARCFDFDGGVGLAPGRESSAGSTFCAIASLKLLDAIDNLSIKRKEGLIEWCIQRQDIGFQGRPNKLSDSCCSFWAGATLAILGELVVADKERARPFHLACQNPVIGGFAKRPDMPPDLLHSFYSVCWLSLCEEPGIGEMNVALGITTRTAQEVRLRSDDRHQRAKETTSS